MWHVLEPINAVTYFAPECRVAMTDCGLRGFWMGYFAARAAPLGTATASTVEATFFNFHPERVHRAIPAAWALATPADVVEARQAAAAAALRRLVSSIEVLAATVSPLLAMAMGAAPPGGRPLFAANRDVPTPDDPVAALWQLATTMREHRGDGHVALLVGAGLDGCEAHVLFAATEQLDPVILQDSRGWQVDDWAAATERLIDRQLIEADGAATPAGRDERARLERRTDELASAAYAGLGEERIDELIAELAPAARAIADSGEISYPNPMGLPHP